MAWIAPIAGLASAFLGKRSADKASKQAGQGFEFLKSSAGVQQAQGLGSAAGGQIGALLGLGGDQAGAEAAFDQYRGSTGFQFRLDQGIGAIEGSRAASGILQSGAAAKELQSFGQNIASSEFSNYMRQLRQSESTGLNAAFNVASSGTTAGASQAEFTMQGGREIASGLGVAAGGFSDMYAQRQG